MIETLIAAAREIDPKATNDLMDIFLTTDMPLRELERHLKLITEVKE